MTNHQHHGQTWTQGELLILEDRWRRGDKTRAIALALNRPVNSIIGKAHRLGLPARPSPLRGGPRKRVLTPYHQPQPAK